jgi:RHS repeat-associated protein
MTQDTVGNKFTYDGENRIIAVGGNSSASYVYSATGNRVRKVAGTTVDYLYDLSGRVITELSGNSWNRVEVYAGARHLATYSGGQSGTTYFTHGDWLGTERMRTDVNGAVYETCTSWIYGDVLSCNGGDPSPLHFTGKQRDPETNLDEFPARYYSSTQGRWLSPDWSVTPDPVPYAKLGDPQTLNLYAYVGGDPTNHADPDGHFLPSPLGGLSPNWWEPPAGDESLANSSEENAVLSAQLNTPAASGGSDSSPAQNNNDQQTQQNQQTSSKLDKDKVVNYMDEHAKSSSTGKCAAACRKGLEAGGLDTAGHPADAKDYGPFLTKHGAEAVSGDNYKPQKGDVAVFQGNDSHPHGHVEIYDGKQWVSDFKQKNFSPYKSDPPPSTVYRFPDSD